MESVDEEIARVERVRKQKGRATLIAVVGGFVVGSAVFFALGFSLPDSRGLATLAGLGAAVLVGVLLRFGLRPKETDFGAVQQARVEAPAEAKGEWERAIREHQSVATKGEALPGDEDVQKMQAAYRSAAKKLWAARLVSGLAGISVAALGLYLFRDADGSAVPKVFLFSFGGGSLLAVLLFQKLRPAPLFDNDESPVLAKVDEQGAFRQALGAAQSVSFIYDRTVVEWLLEHVGLLPASRACTIVDSGQAMIGSVQEEGGLLQRLTRSVCGYRVLDAGGEQIVALTKSGRAWAVSLDREPIGEIRTSFFRKLPVTTLAGGEVIRLHRPFWARGGLIKQFRRGKNRSEVYRRKTGALEPAAVSVELPTTPEDSLKDRALILGLAIVG